MWMLFRNLLAWVTVLYSASFVASETLDEDTLRDLVVPPFSLGERLNDNGVWSLLNSGGADAGYVFETQPLAPLPGFSGAPINILVTLNLEGQFIDARLIEHNEPIFKSGLGEAPFNKFFEQYRGLSISSSIVVGTPYGGAGEGSALVYLDGVTKATASIRIAHESILAATIQVAREKMKGINTQPPAFPDPDYQETLTWQDMIDQGIVTRKTVSNKEINDAFRDTLWEDDDPEATNDPDGIYLDLWVVDLGPPSVAKAVLDQDGIDELEHFLSISTYDEPILVIETGRHGLVSPEFVRNTSPDWLSADQGGLPIALRDSDLYVSLQDHIPQGTSLILRTDRRLGFDPATEWTLNVSAVREHGMFQPETGTVTLSALITPQERFFKRPKVIKPIPPWKEAILNRQTDLIALCVGLGVLGFVLLFRMNWLAGLTTFTPIRLAILAGVVGFIGWWGQGQLSIVTVMAIFRTAIDQGSYTFLLYDPFSLVIWGLTIVGFVLWGRGFFCGWLCPFGALQEFAHHLGRLLRLPEIRVSQVWDDRLKWVKYILLFGMMLSVVIAPGSVDKVAEIEPFKTAITVYFVREWYYVAYAGLWLVLGTMLFKGFCRYVCPLGAIMAIGGLLRGRKWIERRQDCGSPCQLCKVKCNYGTIKKSGEIQYSECFQCLDCVTIHDSAEKCVPLILAAKRLDRSQEAT